MSVMSLLRLRPLLVVSTLFLLFGCASNGTATIPLNMATTNQSENIATLIGDRIEHGLLADEELQISHLNGVDLGEFEAKFVLSGVTGIHWPSQITLDPGEHIVNLRYRQPMIGGGFIANEMVLEEHKSYDKSFKILMLPGQTYRARFKVITEESFLGPKRIGVDMWIEEQSSGKTVSVRVDPIHTEHNPNPDPHEDAMM